MKKIALIVIPILLIIGAAVWFIARDSADNLIIEKKTPHYESSAPASGMVLASPPPNVTIDFNFDLAGDSSISITKDGKDYGSESTSIDENKLAMRRAMKQDAPDGTYVVTYKACWPDNSCHDGQFNFQVRRALASGFTDKRGQSEITISLSEIKFTPKELRISKGTKVIWVNDEAAVHYINTDSHPAHTHTPELNSKAMNKGDNYAFTFTKAGAYPYHCSAHASTMTANIIVE